MPLRAKFRIPPTGVVAIFDEESTGNGRVELDNALFAGGGEWVEYLTIISEPAVDSSSIASYTRINRVRSEEVASSGDTRSFLVFAEESDPFIIKVLTANEAVPHRVFLEDRSVTVVASMRDWTHLKVVAEELEDQYSIFELLGTTQVDGIGYPLGSEHFQFQVHGHLSTEQMQVFEVAYRMGFFEVPQEANAREIAERLAISQSAMSEKLRRAQQNLCDFLFGKRKPEPQVSESE